MLHARNRLDPQHSTGFTLIELVTVMMLLAILSIGTVRFLSGATEGYQQGVERVTSAGHARQVTQHLSHALREALPNSVRVNADGSCVEYIPIDNASSYITAPVGLSSSTMLAVPFDRPVTDSTSRVAIAPGSNSFALTNPGSISPVVAFSGPDLTNQITLTFAATHQFASASPERSVGLRPQRP